MSIQAGSTVRVRVSFVDVAGLPLAVTGVTMAHRHNAGAVVNVDPGNITEESPGIYSTLLANVQPGNYVVQATCAGPAPCTISHSFTVKPSLL